MADARLGHAVDRLGRQRSKGSLRTHIDDATTLLPAHHLSRGWAGKKGALQVDRQGAIEVFFGNVLGKILGSNARVIDQNVQSSKSLNRVIDRLLDLRRAGH